MAELEYTLAIDNYASDEKYFGKALERRAAVRRHLLKNDLAVEDMRRFQKEGPKGSEDANVITRQLEYAQMIGKPAPALDIEAWIQGEPVALESLRGEVVLLYFFASWCQNCEREREFMNDLFQRYAASGLRMIAVTDHSESQTVSSVQTKLAKSPLACVAAMDRGATLRQYAVTKFPDAVLIDRQGRIRWHDNPAALADWTVEALLLEGGETPGK
jgi:peroxiredoxin